MVKIAWYSAMESHMMIYLQLRHHTRPTKRIQVSNQQFDEQYNLKTNVQTFSVVQSNCTAKNIVYIQASI